VEEFRSFWRNFLEWSGLPWNGAVEPVCVGDAGKTARFFPDLRLNYAECLLAGSRDQPVLTACHVGGGRDRFTRGALRIAVVRLARSLQRRGVRRGDHVAAIARNNAEAVIPPRPALPLAPRSLAARRTWACPPSSHASPLSSP
jgi:acetoacetyl-CoA synthetase